MVRERDYGWNRRNISLRYELAFGILPDRGNCFYRRRHPGRKRHPGNRGCVDLNYVYIKIFTRTKLKIFYFQASEGRPLPSIMDFRVPIGSCFPLWWGIITWQPESKFFHFWWLPFWLIFSKSWADNIFTTSLAENLFCFGTKWPPHRLWQWG